MKITLPTRVTLERTEVDVILKTWVNETLLLKDSGLTAKEVIGGNYDSTYEIIVEPIVKNPPKEA